VLNRWGGSKVEADSHMSPKTVRPSRFRGSFVEKWGNPRSVHEITKRDVVELVSAIVQRGASGAANKALKVTLLRLVRGPSRSKIVLPQRGSRFRRTIYRSKIVDVE
jgi:hypothetical protein